MSKTAILVHSYCGASTLPFRLTAMTEESVMAAIRLMKERQAHHIFLSLAYNVWQEEGALKRKLLYKNGISPSQIENVAPINGSFDEIEKTRALVERHDITHLIIAAEEWHAPRAEMIAKAMFPDIQISVVPFKTSFFERTYEPHPVKLLGWIKSVRAGYKPLWIAWNVSMFLLTPLMLRLRRKK
jgi:uncharacterized SAM-binding protein YcdF (DUF218 family)